MTMSATTEAINAIKAIEAIARKKVTCIFCGRGTPVPAVSPGTFAFGFPRRISIIRCTGCGKEATYRACDTSDFDPDVSPMSS